MSPQILSNALFTKTQQQVLGLLYGAPDKSFYTNEIVRIAAISRSTVVRELAKLVAAGLLSVSAAGKQRHYQANPDCPVYAELASIADKLFEVEVSSVNSTAKTEPTLKPVKAQHKALDNPKLEIVKVVSEPGVGPVLNITIDDEGQLGFF